MKKICYFFVFILAILTTILCVEEFNYNYYCKIDRFYSLVNNQLDVKNIDVAIPLSEKSKNTEALIKQITEFAEKNEYTTTILKKDLTANNLKDYIYIYSTKFKLQEEIYLDNNVFVDFGDITHSGYYTTDIDDKNATDIIHLLSNTYRDGVVYPKKYIKQLNEYVNDWGNTQDYLFVTFYSNNIEEAKEKILDEFPGIPLETIFSYDEKFVQERALGTGFKLILITLFVIMILLTCIINKSMREISVRKMHGNSIRQIISVLFGRFFIYEIIVFILGMIVTYGILVGELSLMALNIIEMLLGILGGFILLFIFFTFIIYGFTKLLATALQMKKRNINYALVNFNLVIKLILMIIIIVPFLSTIQSAISSGGTLLEIRKNHDFSKYNYSIEGVFNTEFTNDFEVIKKVQDVSRNILEVIESSGGIYFDTQQFKNDFVEGLVSLGASGQENDKENISKLSKDIFTSSYIPYIMVNKAYLQGYEIIKDDGNKIDIDNIKENTILMPEGRKHAQLSKYFGCESDTPVISVRDGNDYYNPEFDSVYPSKVIKNPIILVVVDYIDGMTPSLGNNYFSDNSDLEKAIDEVIKKADVKVNYKIGNVSKYAENSIKYNQRALTKGIVTVILYTFILLVFLYQSVYLYMEETKKIISVQYILGHSKINRYSEIIVMNLAPHAFLFMMSIIFFSIPIKLIFNFCITFVIIESLFMIYMINKFEKNTVIVVLKGE